ncbi:MAG TPA: hypothetical protein VKT49_01750 [Bryobacteraceae bacterium]|nr:hypothetical protein [Bryobacteraceae bacterium]
MRLAVGMAILTSGLLSWAQPRILPPGYHVTACLKPPARTWTMIRAEYLASQIYAGIGLTLDWAKDQRSCRDDTAIRITLQDSTSPGELLGALAYALPQEGSHVVVFYDRIQKAIESPDVPILLAHVLVHEIAHLLEGFKHHSESGMMKAYWTGEDYRRMAIRPLPFGDGDLWLIRHGLEMPETAHGFVHRLSP